MLNVLQPVSVQNVLAPDCNMFEDEENKTLSYDIDFINSSGAPGWPPFSEFCRCDVSPHSFPREYV